MNKSPPQPRKPPEKTMPRNVPIRSALKAGAALDGVALNDVIFVRPY